MKNRRELLIVPNDSLCLICDDHGVTNEEIVDIATDMAVHLVEQGEMVIAANQVGEHVPMILVRNKEGMCLMYGPRIIRQGRQMSTDFEWCSSVPNANVSISRHRVITVDYVDIEGDRVTEILKGDVARYVQHGIDHLQGILITDRNKMEA